jgi:glucokinase
MKREPALVADVGGTNIRIAVATPGGLQDPVAWRCADFETIGAALKSYLDGSSMRPVPKRAAIAVACPTEDDWIDITNQDWSFSIEQLRQDLELEELRVINDFTALAASIPRLEPQDTLIIKSGEALENAAIAVVGPGTGLGVSGLIRSESGWIPLSAEGGHATLVATNEREWAVIEILTQEFGRVSNERVLSGPGLVNLYQALCKIEGTRTADLTPALIVTGATENPESVEAKTVRMFSGWLGTAAGDLVLSLGARGGVYIGGGVVPKMLQVFDKQYFVERFLDKGRLRSYVEPVPVLLLLNTEIALVGAAAIIQES